MARISLRDYNREIEGLVDSGRTDEAIAHCRYILETYPKHIATYRSLGKALLESQRYGDAADVFKRVLSCIPDDFIAHLGMSIIREDEGDLDGSIWHMERAFEVQPSNAAVQSELRRLYGRRDGLTPAKVQLTRGAMARMSAKSHLYSQAIANYHCFS
jgi:tetratricopeptide (TPR) repeat protein